MGRGVPPVRRRVRRERPGTSLFFGTFYRALDGDADGGGLLAYNFLSGQADRRARRGRPLVVRTPDSRLTLANVARTQVYGAFGTP